VSENVCLNCIVVCEAVITHACTSIVTHLSLISPYCSILINIAIHLVATFTYMDTFEQMDRSYRDSTIALSAQDKDVRFIEMFVSSVGEILFYVFWCVIQACSFSNLEFTKTHFRFLADGWSRMGVFHIFMSLWAFSRIVNDSFLETDAYNARMVTGSLFAVQAFFGFVAALFGCCGGQASVEERKKDRDLELSPL
jgi:hypothetical protein